MDIREIDLPGVGKKFAITTNSGERITIIIHNTGHGDTLVAVGSREQTEKFIAFTRGGGV